MGFTWLCYSHDWNVKFLVEIWGISLEQVQEQEQEQKWEQVAQLQQEQEQEQVCEVWQVKEPLALPLCQPHKTWRPTPRLTSSPLVQRQPAFQLNLVPPNGR